MVNDSNIITIDSIESKMKVNKFSGNHSQETREGYNLWDYLSAVLSSAGGLTIEKDYENGYITVNGMPNKDYVSIVSTAYITNLLEDGQRYTLWQENYQNEETAGIYLQVTRTDDNGTTRYYSLSNSATFLVDKSNNASYSITLQTSTIDGTGTLTNYKNRYMLYKGTDEKTYELPGASPSLDYPSPVRAVGDNVNILPNNAVSTSHNGVNYTINEDGSIYAVGTATSNSQVILAGQLSATEEVFKFKKSIQYKNVGNVRITYRKTDGNYGQISPSSILAPEEDISIGCLYIEVVKNYSVDILYYPKLVEYYEGMDESYSPYGQGSVEIKKINSNIMPIQTEKYWEYTENGIKNKANSVGKTITEFTIKKGQTIKIGFIAFTKPSENTTFTCQINDMENSSLNIARFNNFNLNQKYEFSYTAVEDVVFKYVLNGNSANETFEFQLWANLENAEDYQQYEEQSYILDIQKPMLLGDYFVKETDGWKEVHTFNKKTFDGTENISITNNGNSFSYIASNILALINNYAIPKLYSNYYIASNWNDRNYNKKANTIGLYNITIGFDQGNLTTADEFKQLLAQKNTEGNPVYVYYPLATPTKLACTEEQITVLNQLQNIILYDDTTNIVLPDVYPILDYDVSKIIDTTTTFEASLDSNGYFVVPDYDIKCLVSYSESDIPSMPEAVETVVSVPGRDGDVPLNTIYNPISFTIVCYTEDNLTPEEKYAEETKMNKFLNSIKNNTIKLKLESKGKYYNVKYNGQLTTTNYPKHLQFSIPLKSSSSYAKNIEEYYILGNGEKESNTIKEVGAVFVIDGPAQTPKISLNDYEMFYDNVLLSNTKLVIDSNKSTVTMINREGTATNAMRYYNHEFPKIQNGNNVLKVLSGIDEDRQVNVRWFDLKL